jgi:predicted transcriptional regulator
VKTTAQPTSVRLPERVRNRVAELATSERRSFHNMLVMVIEDGLALWDAQRETDTIPQAAPEIGGSSTPAAEPIRQANGPDEASGAGNEPVTGAASSRPRRRAIRGIMCEHRVRAGMFCKRCNKVIE